MKTLIKSVHVWQAGIFEINDVVVEDKKIVSLGSGSRDADMEQVIDGRGKYLLPGVIDCHAHSTMVCGTRHMQEFFAANESMLTVNSVIHAEKMARCGITAIRDCGGRWMETLAVRDSVQAGKLIGPRMLCSGTPIKVIGGHEPGTDITGPYEARAKVREMVHLGVDFIKVMVTGGLGKPGEKPGRVEMEQEELDAIVSEAARHGRKVACHCHSREGMELLVHAGAASIEHSTYLDPEINKKIMEKGIYVVPTFEPYMNYAFLGEKHGQMMDTVLAARAIVEEKKERLYEAYCQGVKLAFGRDSGGFMMDQGDFVEEMLYMEKAGISRVDIIHSATKNAADLLGILDKTGTIARGKDADLILLGENPLENLSAYRDSLKGVWVQGQYLPAGTREKPCDR
ncbi:MAG: amidohydrolase family protein [Lachnospiraceae bacterium]|jgi:imidazolonepropionase-like amidohydrolase|nr:amidohydrolase family protein [Lachnospiraceae bacterium]